MIRFKPINTEGSDEQDFGCQEKEEAKVVTLYHEGLEQMIDSQSYSFAITKFKQVLRYFKDNQKEVPVLPITIGAKRPREEDEIIQESTLDRVHFLSHKNLATVLFEMGFMDKAIKHYRKALELNDKDIITWHRYSECLAVIENFAAARQVLEHMTLLDPTYWPGFHDLISLLHRIGDYEECKAWAEKSLEKHPYQETTRAMLEQLNSNFCVVPSKFIRRTTPRRTTGQRNRTILLEQLSWYSLGQLLLSAEKEKKDEEDIDEDDIFLPEPIICVEITETAKKDCDKPKMPTKSKKPVLEPKKRSGRIMEKKSKNEFLNFFNELFSQSVEPFALAHRKRNRSSAAYKIEHVSPIEAAQVVQFLHEYGNVPSNGNVIEYGNSGLGHLVTLYLRKIFDLGSEISSWDPGLQQVIVELDIIRRKSYSCVETFELMIGEIHLDLFYEASTYYPRGASECLHNAAEYLARLLTETHTWGNLLDLGNSQVARFLWFRGSVEAARQNSAIAEMFIQEAQEQLDVIDKLTLSHCLTSISYITTDEIQKKLEQLRKLRTFDQVWDLYNHGDMNGVHRILSSDLLDDKSSCLSMFTAKSRLELLEMLFKSSFAVYHLGDFCKSLRMLLEEKVRCVVSSSGNLNTEKLPLTELNEFLEQLISLFLGEIQSPMLLKKNGKYYVNDLCELASYIAKLLEAVSKSGYGIDKKAKEDERISFILNAWITLYYMSVYNEIFSSQADNIPPPTELTSARLNFIRHSHQEIYDKCTGCDYKYLKWIRDILIHFACSYITKSEAEDEMDIDDVDWDQFNEVFAQTIFCLHQCKLLTAYEYQEHQKSGKEIKSTIEDAKHLLVAIIYFEDTTKTTKNLTDAIEKVFPDFEMISGTSYCSSKDSIMEFINGERSTLPESNTLLRLPDDMDRDAKMTELIYNRCYFLFASKIKHKEPTKKYELLISSLAVDNRNYDAWILLGEYYRNEVMQQICLNSTSERSQEKENLIDTNIRRTIQIYRRACALSSDVNQEIHCWREMGRFYYVVCQCKGKEYVFWKSFMEHAKECFLKLKSIAEREKIRSYWTDLLYLGKTKEKVLFYELSNWRSLGISPEDYVVNGMRHVLDEYRCATQIVEDNASSESIYRLHASRAKFLFWGKENDFPMPHLLEMLYEFQFNSEDSDSTEVKILQDCSNALAAIQKKKEHRAIYMQARISQALGEPITKTRDILSNSFSSSENTKKLVSSLKQKSKNTTKWDSNSEHKYNYYYEKYTKLWLSLIIELKDYKTLGVFFRAQKVKSKEVLGQYYTSLFDLCVTAVDECKEILNKDLLEDPTPSQDLQRSICYLCLKLYQYFNKTESPKKHQSVQILSRLYTVCYGCDTAPQIDEVEKFFVELTKKSTRKGKRRSSLRSSTN